MELKEFVARLTAHDFVIGLGGRFIDDADGFLSKFGSNVGANNDPNYRSPAYDALLARAHQAVESDVYNARLADAESLLLHDAAVIPILAKRSYFLVSKRVRGFQPYLGLMPSISEISLTDARQEAR
jgi:ABC-type oligopeptide transport system substrate-binding subunit